MTFRSPGFHTTGFCTTLALLFGLWLADPAAAQVPAFVTALDSAAVAARGPDEAPEQWRLAFIDIETTGLVPGYHEMIDLGVIVTDLAGEEVGRLFVRIQPDHPERLAPGAAAVNAFSADRWQQLGAVSPEAAVDSLVAFHTRTAAGRDVLMVAYNATFDAAFLDHLFRSTGRSWRELYHYFILDLPSMAWSLGYRQLGGGALSEALGIVDETRVPEDHTGLTGAAFNAAVYRALQQQSAAAGNPAP